MGVTYANHCKTISCIERHEWGAIHQLKSKPNPPPTQLSIVVVVLKITLWSYSPGLVAAHLIVRRYGKNIIWLKLLEKNAREALISM